MLLSATIPSHSYVLKVKHHSCLLQWTQHAISSLMIILSL